MRIKLTLSYDGTEFIGWQRQPKGRSVQQEIESVLQKIYREETLPLYGAGRTDSGVHARGQVAHFTAPSERITPQDIARALNGNLPRDIHVLRSEEVDDNFHARFDAVLRSYRYYIVNSEVADVHRRGYSLWLRQRLDLPMLNDLSASLVGEHNFRTFSVRSDKEGESYVRRMRGAHWTQEGDLLTFHISGNGFLRRMVRSIVGTLLDVSKLPNPTQEFAHRLRSQDRNFSGLTAPPQGLFLHEVLYE